MQRILKLAAIFFVAHGVHAQANLSVAERYLFSMANAERAQQGIPALRWDEGLSRAARAHCNEMAARQSISHGYPGEPELAERAHSAGAHFSTVAENVAEAPTAVRIHDAWMHSAGHRANLLDPRVDSVGISVLQRGGQLYAVQDFDRSTAELSLDEQELTVAHLLQAATPVHVTLADTDARATCAQSSGYVGSRRPLFVIRFTAADLTALPPQLRQRLADARYREASVGACTPIGTGPFTGFQIAVLLYP